MRRLEDLRFAVGALFFIIGILLLIAGLTLDGNPAGAHLDFYAGAGLLVFSTLAIALSVLRPL